MDSKTSSLVELGCIRMTIDPSGNLHLDCWTKSKLSPTQIGFVLSSMIRHADETRIQMRDSIKSAHPLMVHEFDDGVDKAILAKPDRDEFRSTVREREVG
jgi:hypothetical protein